MVRWNFSGFTIAELLVVMAILTVIGGILTEVFVRSLQGSNKSQMITRIKQNGQNILGIIDQNTRNANNIVCPNIPAGSTTASADTLVTEKNGTYTRIRIIGPNSNGSLCDTVPNGQVCQDNPTPTITEQANLSLFINRVCRADDPLGVGTVALTDTNADTGVSVTPDPPPGSFKRDRKAGFKDTITVSFSIGPSPQASQILISQVETIPFKTTIELR